MSEREYAIIRLREIMSILKKIDNLVYNIDDRRYPEVMTIRSLLAYVDERLYAIERILLKMEEVER